MTVPFVDAAVFDDVPSLDDAAAAAAVAIVTLRKWKGRGETR